MKFTFFSFEITIKNIKNSGTCTYICSKKYYQPSDLEIKPILKKIRKLYGKNNSGKKLQSIRSLRDMCSKKFGYPTTLKYAKEKIEENIVFDDSLGCGVWD